MKLKRCPFCGGKAIACESYSGFGRVGCIGFSCDAEQSGPDLPEAAKRWNRRVKPRAPKAKARKRRASK